MKFLRRQANGSSGLDSPMSVDSSGGPWAPWERPERSDRAKGAGMPHRYRGGLLMLTRDADPVNRVVRTKTLAGDDRDGPAYISWNEREDLVEFHESELVAPDEARLRTAIGAIETDPASAHTPDWNNLFDVLLSSYVWMTSEASLVEGGKSYEEFLFLVHRKGREMGAFRKWPSGPLPVFTDLARAEEFHRVRQHRAVAARVPFVLACRLAEVLGNSESILINPTLVPFGLIPRDAYRSLADAVVGYDLSLRGIPPDGLDPAWLEPLRIAVNEQAEIRGAHAWLTATPPEGGLDGAVIECLGLTLDEGLGEPDFDRIRTAIRDRASGLGMVNRPYGLAEVPPGDPHVTDRMHVVHLKGPGEPAARRRWAVRPSEPLTPEGRQTLSALMLLKDVKRPSAPDQTVEAFALAHPFAGRGSRMYVLEGESKFRFMVTTGALWGSDGGLRHKGDTHGLARMMVSEDDLIEPDEVSLRRMLRMAADGTLPPEMLLSVLRTGYAWIVVGRQVEVERRLVRWIGLGWTLGDGPQAAYVTEGRAGAEAEAQAGDAVQLPIAALAYLAPGGLSLHVDDSQTAIEIGPDQLADLRRSVPITPLDGAPTKDEVRMGALAPNFDEAPNLPSVPLLA